MTLELVFDFDGTITEDDTITSVVNAALTYHKTVSAPERFDSLADAWRHVVKSYMADLDAYHKDFDYTVQHDQSTPLDVARAQFSNDQRRQIERASLLRVKDAGFFRDVPLGYLFRCGQENREKNAVKLCNGFSDVIHLIQGPSVRPTPPPPFRPKEPNQLAVWCSLLTPGFS